MSATGSRDFRLTDRVLRSFGRAVTTFHGSAFPTCMEASHAGSRKTSKGAYEVSRGTRGLGISCSGAIFRAALPYGESMLRAGQLTQFLRPPTVTQSSRLSAATVAD